MQTAINRTSHVKAYVKSTYPKMDLRKFEIAKIGVRVYMFGIDAEGSLKKLFIFQGNLPAMNELDVLKKSFERNVKSAVEALGRL